MARTRFVLRFRGEGSKPDVDVERIRLLPDAIVLDESSPRMVLVESEEAPLRRLVESLPGWVVAPETAMRLPDTRKRVLRPPPSPPPPPPQP